MSNQAPSGEPAPHHNTALVSPPEGVGGSEPVPPSALEACLPALRRYANTLTRNAADSDDLVQDTAVRVLSKLHLFIVGSSFLSWSLRIMHNVWHQTLRYRKPRVMSSIFDEQDIDSSLRIEPAQEHRVRAYELERAIRTLSSHNRDAIMAMRYYGMTRDQAAVALGAPNGTISSRILNGQKQLRKLMDE